MCFIVHLYRPLPLFEKGMIQAGGMINSLPSMVNGGTSSKLKEVGRVRQIFPETWLWTNKTIGYLKNIIAFHLILL